DVAIAELRERSRRERRARPARAVEHHLAVLLGHHLLDLRLEESAGDARRARDEARAIFLTLADIDQHGLLARLEPALEVVEGDFLDRATRLGHQVAERLGHRNPPLY